MVATAAMFAASSAISADRLPHRAMTSWNGRDGCALAQVLDLFGEDSWRNAYAGEPDVRPPGAPTTRGMAGGRGFLTSLRRRSYPSVLGMVGKRKKQIGRA